MKCMLACVALIALPLVAQDVASAKNRRELVVQLVSDTSAARSNATLTDEQKKQLDYALEGLRKASARRRKGERPNQEQTKQSLKTILQLTQNDAFKAEDLKKVQADLQAIREFKQKKKAGKNN